MTRDHGALTLVCPLVLLAVACSARPEAEPQLGGGGAGAFAGALTVFVVDEADRPLAGATVRVDGETATSDAEGRVDFELATYDEVEVQHGAHVERWLGLSAAVLTVPMPRSEPLGPGTLEGRLGVEDLSLTDPSHHFEAVVAVSHGRRIDRDPPPLSVHCPDVDDCAFSFSVPPSSRQVFAELLELDATGAVTSVRALWVSPTLEVETGSRLDVALEPVPSPRRVELSAPAADEAFDAVVGVPGVTLEQQVLVFSERAEGVPRLLPPGAQAVWAVVSGGRGTGRSRAIVRADAAVDRLELPALAPLPEATVEADRVHMPAGAYRVLRTADEVIRVFDDRDAAPRPGRAAMELELTEVAFDSDGVSLDAIEREWVRRVRVDL